MCKYYRSILLFTLSEQDQGTLNSGLENKFKGKYSKMKDQSTISISCDCPSGTIKHLREITKTLRDKGDKYFVKLYYAAALSDVKDPKKRDSIIEKTIWGK